MWYRATVVPLTQMAIGHTTSKGKTPGQRCNRPARTLHVSQQMIISFQIADGLTFCRYRASAGTVEDGKFVVTDAPGERTGPFGKWHVYGSELRTACGKLPPDSIDTGVETTIEAPPGPAICLQCLTRD